MSIDVLVNRFCRVSEVVIINIFCDTKEEVAVSEHLSHVNNVLCGDINCSTVKLQDLISFASVISRDL